MSEPSAAEAAPPPAPPAAERSSNFYLGFLFLPRRRREALEAVYAFCRAVDDIVDSGEHTEAQARAHLDAWRAELARLYAGESRHALARRLEPFVRELDLPREAFLDMIDGMQLDLDRKRYEGFAELERYLYGAAGTVGLLCVRIFGAARTPAPELREYALAMGNAFQLTNILRDVGADLERGRVYLPLADLRACGYPLDALLRREHNAAFEALMELQYARARDFYAKARGLLHPGDRRAMLPAEVMARVYEELLERLRAGRWRVFFRRERVPLGRKLLLALQAWAASRGIY